MKNTTADAATRILERHAKSSPLDRAKRLKAATKAGTFPTPEGDLKYLETPQGKVVKSESSRAIEVRQEAEELEGVRHRNK